MFACGAKIHCSSPAVKRDTPVKSTHAHLQLVTAVTLLMVIDRALFASRVSLYVSQSETHETHTFESETQSETRSLDHVTAKTRSTQTRLLVFVTSVMVIDRSLAASRVSLCVSQNETHETHTFESETQSETRSRSRDRDDETTHARSPRQMQRRCQRTRE